MVGHGCVGEMPWLPSAAGRAERPGIVVAGASHDVDPLSFDQLAQAGIPIAAINGYGND